MRKKLNFIVLASLLLIGSVFVSCQKEQSPSTGWNYNDPKWGGFEKAADKQQITGPGLIAIEGGTFTMGATSEDLSYEWNNLPRQVTVSSFYIDKTEVTNIDYREYTYWLNRVYGQDYPTVYHSALPDTLVWRSQMSYNEPMVEMYFRHPKYNDFPVVGVTWLQATDYSNWRTDRVNEKLLIDAGIIEFDPEQQSDNNFNTDAYLAGQYAALVKDGKKNLDPTSEGIRGVTFEDGILLPKYRLPTEAEWEYAALGLVGNTMQERIVERRVYPWNGTSLRTDDKRYYGSFVTNFKRGPGDYMGVAGSLNDGAALPGSVGSFWPNDYGLYNMAGNVSEWVFDVYRPLTFEDMADFNPVRGNIFMNKKRDADGFLVEKDSLGRIQYEEVSPEEAAKRKNYRTGYNINYGDGDYMSSIQTSKDWKNIPEDTRSTTEGVYEYGVTTLISDKSRVYKGGSWLDSPHYMSPGIRRFLNEDESSSTIGFRCAMNKVGSATTGN